MSEIRRLSMPMMQLALMDRIAIDSPFKLIPTLTKSDNIIESRRTRGNARIPTVGNQVRKGLARDYPFFTGCCNAHALAP